MDDFNVAAVDGVLYSEIVNADSTVVLAQRRYALCFQYNGTVDVLIQLHLQQIFLALHEPQSP